jgi:hypothetical protein
MVKVSAQEREEYITRAAHLGALDVTDRLRPHYVYARVRALGGNHEMALRAKEEAQYG